MRRRFKVGITAGLALLILAFSRPDDLYFLIKKNFAIFGEVYREVSTFYVDAVDPQSLMRTGIDAMLSRLDPYTVLIDEGRNQQMEILSRGQYGGVGLEVDYRNGQIIVVTPVDGASAARNGVRPGDVIVRVNGLDVTNINPSEVEALMAGEIGSKVEVGIQRRGFEDVLEFSLVRERINVPNVSFSSWIGEDSTLVYVSLSQFGEGAAHEVRETLIGYSAIKDLGGIILDLRNNPGGLLNEAVQIVDLFLPPNHEVVRTKGRLSENNSTYLTESKDAFEQVPVVVLINEGSASASEIVAGALQDWDRAVVVGRTSFGKGLVQIVRPLPYNLALKITTSRYYIPSGRSIQSILYQHRDINDESRVADSLRRAFRTKGGRTVFDGTGIQPDLELENEELSLLELELMKQSMFLFFANQYEGDFNLENLDENRLFEEFLNFLETEEFQFQSKTERMLLELKRVATAEGVDLEDSEFVQIQQTLDAYNMELMRSGKGRLIDFLELELVSRFGTQKDRKRMELEKDEWIDEAEALFYSEAYSEVLSGD